MSADQRRKFDGGAVNTPVFVQRWMPIKSRRAKFFANLATIQIARLPGISSP
ncbi:MAG: hypothetical protein JNM18_19835 [Planctomycetaceae bacterium]|nr:hypothetical protein [Planctomycetaceae bacterium]